MSVTGGERVLVRAVPTDPRPRASLFYVPALSVDFAVSERDASAWDADTAVAILHAAHYRRLVRTSALLVRDLATAEEVVQDAFVGPVHALGQAAGPRRRRSATCGRRW